jgi:hypothetical protein
LGEESAGALIGAIVNAVGVGLVAAFLLYAGRVSRQAAPRVQPPSLRKTGLRRSLVV